MSDARRRDISRLGPASLQTVVWTATGAAGILGLFGALHLAWVCDDAFISFRYAQNLADGLGLVYNAGERVEGYSNFLWTLAISGALKMGLDPVLFSEAAGLLCYAATLGLLLRTSLRIAGERGRGALVVPIAAIGLSLHRDARTFATGGLETAFFTFLVTAVVVLAVEARKQGAHLLVGILAVLAALTRPDGALFLVVAALVPLRDLLLKKTARPLVFVALPAVALYAPYLVWKILYYGDLLANTYYAKSADPSYYSQGLRYLWFYFRSYWVLALGAAGLAWLLLDGVGRRGGDAVEEPLWSGLRAPSLLMTAIAVYLAFIARVGGDFMFARFCIPVTPLLFLGLELIASRWARDGYRLLFAVFVAWASWARVAPPGEMAHLGNTMGIVEERSFYPAEIVADARRLGAQIHELTAGLPMKVAIYGSQAMLAYYARFPYVIEANTGLTDREIARMPVDNQGRVGHKKAVSRDYLIQRGVDLIFSFGLFYPRTTPVYRVRLGDSNAVLVTYRRELANALRGRKGVEIPDFERILDDYIATIDGRSHATLQRDYQEFKVYYFDHNHDPTRQALFDRALGVAGQR